MTDDFSKATPRPWAQYGRMIWGGAGDQAANICVISEPRATRFVEYTELRFDSPDADEAYANAGLIVAAVNAYRTEPPTRPHDYEGMVCKNCGEKYDRLKSTIWCSGRAEPSDEDVERAIQAACPYFCWLDDGGQGNINDAPITHPCRKCQPNDGPHGGTAGCRLVVEKMVRAALRAKP